MLHKCPSSWIEHAASVSQHFVTITKIPKTGYFWRKVFHYSSQFWRFKGMAPASALMRTSWWLAELVQEKGSHLVLGNREKRHQACPFYNHPFWELPRGQRINYLALFEGYVLITQELPTRPHLWKGSIIPQYHHPGNQTSQHMNLWGTLKRYPNRKILAC
jgi:hypothetical protein